MATPTQIAELREAIQQPDNTAPYTDEFLSALIDAYGLNGAAGRVWRSKASSASTLVDISEGGSSRKNSQIFENWSAIAKSYEDKDTVEDAVVERKAQVFKIGRLV